MTATTTSTEPNPFGATNMVEFKHGAVNLVGTFTLEQLEAVLAAMAGPR